MANWSVKVKKILQENSIKIWLASGYIDDMRFLTNYINYGTRWSGKEKKMIYSKEWEEEEKNKEGGYSIERKTSDEVRNVMNSVYKDIRFTSEIEEDFDTRRIPTLDFEMWLEKNEGNPNDTQEEREAKQRRQDKIVYSFYEKPMSSQFCVMENSAMSWNTKRATLSQEIVRRMLNTSEQVTQSERDKIIEKFLAKMKKSGYSKRQRREVTIAGLKGYETRKRRAEEKNTELHRNGASTLVQRYKKKLTGKTSWYKQKKKKREACPNSRRETVWSGSTNERRKVLSEDEKPPTAVLFVPRTHEGELAQLLREAEKQLQQFCNSKVKIVEETGEMAKSLVHRANHWAGGDCGRQTCMACTTGDTEKSGDCRRRGVTYLTECRKCLAEGRKVRYLGETARTCYERGIEHQRDAVTEKELSHINGHREDKHPEDHPGEKLFSMRVVRTHRSALTRQIEEAVLIANSQGVELLNSKDEYNRCIIPRLTIMVGKRDIGEENLIGEEEFRDMEENTKDRKRAGRSLGPKPKRRKRWKVENKEKREDQGLEEHPEAKQRFGKKRRVESSGRYRSETRRMEAWLKRDTPEREKNHVRKEKERCPKVGLSNSKFCAQLRKQGTQANISHSPDCHPTVSKNKNEKSSSILSLFKNLEAKKPIQSEGKPRRKEESRREHSATKKCQAEIVPKLHHKKVLPSPKTSKESPKFASRKKKPFSGVMQSPYKKKSNKMRDIRIYFENNSNNRSFFKGGGKEVVEQPQILMIPSQKSPNLSPPPPHT